MVKNYQNQAMVSVHVYWCGGMDTISCRCELNRKTIIAKLRCRYRFGRQFRTEISTCGTKQRSTLVIIAITLLIVGICTTLCMYVAHSMYDDQLDEQKSGIRSSRYQFQSLESSLLSVRMIPIFEFSKQFEQQSATPTLRQFS